MINLLHLVLAISLLAQKRASGFSPRSSLSASHIGTSASACRRRLYGSSSAEQNERKDAVKEDTAGAVATTIAFNISSSISDIPSEAWNACGDENGSLSPFMQHSWIQCLEESGCASPKTGWVPQHISIIVNGDTKGFVPLYLKGHSLGEFIFDQGWAEAAYQSGIQYYPKLLVAVPFTPATGQRIIWHPSVYKDFSPADLAKLRQGVFTYLRQIAQSNKLSSVHVNYLTDDEATDVTGALDDGNSVDTDSNIGTTRYILDSFFNRMKTKDDYVRRTSIQYQWTNQNPKNDNKPFTSFDDYLNCFKSKKRINIKRERRMVLEDEGIVIDAVCGKDILKVPGLVERMFQIYVSTINKLYYGRQYLTVDFFTMLAQSDFIDNLCFLCARYKSSGDKLRSEDVFAGTFNIIKDGVFYGRYWGCLLDPEVKHLHFETCYWSAIEYCINNGLDRMEPGAGGGDTKWARGFDAALVHSVHYVVHPGLRRAVQEFVSQETLNNIDVTNYLQQKRGL